MHLKSSTDRLLIISSKRRPLEILFGSKVLGYYHPEVPDLCLELIDSMGLELSDSWLENQLIVSGCQWWDNYCRHLAMSLSSFRDVPEILGSVTLLTTYTKSDKCRLSLWSS